MKLKKLFVVPILKLSISVFLGKFVMNVGKYIVNLMSNLMYSSVTDGLIVGALSVSNNMCGLITSPTNAFEEGESTIVSQNIGNKNIDRTIATFIRTSIIVMTISIVGYILVRFVFLDNLVNLFVSTKINDATELEKSQKLVQYIKEVFVYDSLSIPTLGVTACVLGLLYGYGKTFLASILNFSRIGTRILSILILYNIGIGYEATGIAMGISNSIIMILSIVCLIIFFSKFKYEKMNILNRL
jgi:Na+-driven multidrug efflux pump